MKFSYCNDRNQKEMVNNGRNYSSKRGKRRTTGSGIRPFKTIDRINKSNRFLKKKPLSSKTNVFQYPNSDIYNELNLLLHRHENARQQEMMFLPSAMKGDMKRFSPFNQMSPYDLLLQLLQEQYSNDSHKALQQQNYNVSDNFTDPTPEPLVVPDSYHLLYSHLVNEQMQHYMTMGQEFGHKTFLNVDDYVQDNNKKEEPEMSSYLQQMENLLRMTQVHKTNIKEQPFVEKRMNSPKCVGCSIYFSDNEKLPEPDTVLLKIEIVPLEKKLTNKIDEKQQQLKSTSFQGKLQILEQKDENDQLQQLKANSKMSTKTECSNKMESMSKYLTQFDIQEYTPFCSALIKPDVPSKLFPDGVPKEMDVYWTQNLGKLEKQNSTKDSQ